MNALELDAYFAGDAFEAYRWFGPQHTKDGVVFRVCAPHARRVMLIGAWNGWTETEMERVDPRGVYALCVPEAQPVHMYKYSIEE